MKIDSDGDVAVAFGNQAWVFNPALLSPAPGEKPAQLKEEVDFSKSTSKQVLLLKARKLIHKFSIRCKE